MGGEKQEVKIISVDKAAIRTGEDKKNQWFVPFKLSLSPDRSWQEKFYEVQQRNTAAAKRKSQLVKDLIIVEVSGDDDLQKILDMLKIEVLEANTLCEDDYQKKIKLREDLETLQREQKNATQKFKDDSDKLMF